MKHPWHDLPVGKDAPQIVTAVIEIPVGSRQKYEIDKDSGLLKMDRVLSSPMVYPANYGFIPQTFCDDGDALDILVLGQGPAVPLCLMNARVLGGLHMIDGGEEDDKIIAVHKDDPQFKAFQTCEQLEAAHGHWLKEIEHFFKTYKLLEKKTVEVNGWHSQEKSYDLIRKAQEFYKKKY